MKKLLLAVQFYDGDRDEAMRLARFISDIEPKPRSDVEFCFAARRGAEPLPRTVMQVSEKFRVWQFLGTRTESGWPDGPNCLWHELMDWSHRMTKEGKGNWDAILTIEADCVPLSRDWLTVLMREWDKAVFQGKFIVGAKIESANKCDRDWTHINGNAMWDAQLTRKIGGLMGTPYQYSWDVYHAPKFMKHAMPTNLIRSLHNIEKTHPVTKRMLYDPTDGITPVLFHGAKSPKAEQIVRKHLIIA